MGQPPPEEPKLVRRLSVGHLEAFLSVKRSYDGMATSIRDEDPDEAQMLEIEASQLREFLWSVRDGDEVWLAEAPPHHPELARGVTYLAVVRDRKVVAKHRLRAD